MAVRILQEDQKNKGSGLRSSHGPGPEESGPMVVMVISWRFAQRNQ